MDERARPGCCRSTAAMPRLIEISRPAAPSTRAARAPQPLPQRAARAGPPQPATNAACWPSATRGGWRDEHPRHRTPRRLQATSANILDVPPPCLEPRPPPHPRRHRPKDQVVHAPSTPSTFAIQQRRSGLALVGESPAAARSTIARLHGRRHVWPHVGRRRSSWKGQDINKAMAGSDAMRKATPRACR